MAEGKSVGRIECASSLLTAGFVQTPIIVLRDEHLSAGAKLIYGALLWYLWRGGDYPGQAAMAQEFGISERSVRTHLGELINQDYLSVIRHGLGQPNTYTILCPWEQTSDRQNMPVKAAKSAGQGGKSNRLTTRRNDKDSLTKDEQPPDGGSVSLADQIGQRYGRNARDAQALTTSLSKHPEAALQWAAEALENGLGGINNPAAWLNAVVPRLAQELQERQREHMTAREDRLAMIRATASFYGTVEDEAGVRERLLQDFGDAELVTEALG